MNMNGIGAGDFPPGGEGSGADDAALGRLLQGVGSRPLPPPDVAERIRGAVAAEWRGTVLAQRRAARRRTATWLAAAASVAVAAVATWVAMPRTQGPLPAMASISRTVGPVQYRTAGGAWQPAQAGVPVYPAQVIATAAGGHAALALASGVSLRLDENSRLAMTGPAEVRLEAGAVYLDSGAGVSDLVVSSRFGSTRHLGTQYEVRLQPEALLVSVREGRVVTSPVASAPVAAAAGERLQLGLDGRVVRSQVPAHDPAWNWIHQVTPEFAIENRPFSEFVTWVARETGRELEWASAADEAAAARVVLRGSVTGLSPDQALDAVVATTRFQARTSIDRIQVSRGADSD